jgi:hypothetical protein
MTFQPTSSPSLNETVWFWKCVKAPLLSTPDLNQSLIDIKLACWEFALRCWNCLNRSREWRCEQWWERSWVQVSEDSIPCDLHDFNHEKRYM